ncbi:hypothetical protein [Stenotrophomonas rhizophila]|jgi:hypothetical protein|uniref:hypothetical protein n=1 Tax=Stenotrophomonas rhizophila TaxID=216778 RepID=UPI0013754A6A|nr:hypothetical protein [Stenotrophomonas rhizophila]
MLASRRAGDARFEHAGVKRDGGHGVPVVAVSGQSIARPSSSSVVYRYTAR